MFCTFCIGYIKQPNDETLTVTMHKNAQTSNDVCETCMTVEYVSDIDRRAKLHFLGHVRAMYILYSVLGTDVPTHHLFAIKLEQRMSLDLQEDRTNTVRPYQCQGMAADTSKLS